MCSNCAERFPSAVTAVQLSGQWISFHVPSQIMGSMVKVCPGLTMPTALFSTKHVITYRATNKQISLTRVMWYIWSTMKKSIDTVATVGFDY